MGRVVDGRWTTENYLRDEEGRFRREPTSFRGVVSGDPGSEHPPEVGRYRLYVSHACPWAHRTLMLRALKGLEEAIPISVVHPRMGDEGWTFEPGAGVVPDPVFGVERLHELYCHVDPAYTGRVTVPILLDQQSRMIVNNESRLIIRMLDHGFDEVARKPEVDLCPPELEADIEAAIDGIYEPVNNGVYRSGFAGTQEAYDEAIDELFSALDGLEERLSNRPYLCGDRLTEADVCLFPTLLRFDPVYVTHFKCNLRRIADYPNLHGFLRRVYKIPGVAETCHLDHIREHYYWSHDALNPRRIIARGFDPGLG